MTFALVRPTEGLLPLIVEVPHAGTEIPPDVAALLTIDARQARRDADSYVDELFRSAPTFGATLLVANLSRYVVDLNRDEADVDTRAVCDHPHARDDVPRGVIWVETSHARPVLRRPLSAREFEQRLETYHRPYHHALAREIAALRERFGFALVLCAHSMPSTSHAAGGERERRRADVVPGTRGRTTAAAGMIDAIDVHFRAAGLAVRHDDPYRGGATTARWGRPADGIHAVQLELNRALYMDETSGTRRRDGFMWLAALCDGLVERLGQLASWRR